jgi:hypothetical protein
VAEASIYGRGPRQPPAKATLVIVSRGEAGALYVNCAGFKTALRNIVEVAQYLDIGWEDAEVLLSGRRPSFLFRREGRWVP